MNFAHFNSTCLSGSDSLFQRGCSYLALKWLHRQADVLFILGYCIIFLLKSIFVVILRKELGELMKEIQHARTNRHNLVGTMYSTPCHGAESFKPKVETTYGLHSNNFRSINELITEIPLVHLRQSSSRRANAI